jgi:hypothetical protein
MYFRIEFHNFVQNVTGIFIMIALNMLIAFGRMPIFTIFTIANPWKQPRCPTTDEWIKKLWNIYTMEFYSAIRNNDTWFEGKWMQLGDIILSEVSQPPERQMAHIFSHMWKTDPKDKDIHKNKHDHTQTHM